MEFCAVIDFNHLFEASKCRCVMSLLLSSYQEQKSTLTPLLKAFSVNRKALRLCVSARDQTGYFGRTT